MGEEYADLSKLFLGFGVKFMTQPRNAQKGSRMSSNKNMHSAKREKNDEFYTLLKDIEEELSHYKAQFHGSKVYCNCDDYRISNFYKYFRDRFDELGLTSVTATHFSKDGVVYKAVYDGVSEKTTPLKQNGDFRSEECLALLKEADIVCTNPPFSLFREYVEQLVSFGKKFLIIGNMNAITYKEVFKLIKENKVWLGGTRNPKVFTQPDGTIKTLGNSCWYTNLLHNRRAERLLLTKKYAGNEDKYPRYDNYDAIEVSKVKDIPMDYPGVMGVPITFLEKHNPHQSEIVGIDRYVEDNPNYGKRFNLNKKEVYARILIRNLNPIVGEQRVVPITFLEKHNPQQFEIVDCNDYRTNPKTPYKAHGLIKDKDGAINGKPKYARILIRNLNPIVGEQRVVPITFLEKHNPQQFEILGITDRENSSGLRVKKYGKEISNFNDLNARSTLRVGNIIRGVYARILIRNLNPREF
jgi:hypothetical protein